MLRISKYFNMLVEDGFHAANCAGDFPSLFSTILQTGSYLLTFLTFPYFQGFLPLKILYMYPFPLFLPLWDNHTKLPLLKSIRLIAIVISSSIFDSYIIFSYFHFFFSQPLPAPHYINSCQNILYPEDIQYFR